MPADDPSERRTLTCDHVCPSTSANVATKLLEAIARATVYQTNFLSTSASKSEKASSCARELERALLDGEGKTLKDLLDAINNWTASKRGFMSEVLGSSDENVRAMEKELDLVDVWPDSKRHALAVRLVRDHFDVNHQAHCSTSFDDEEGLYAHKLKDCSFRPMSCENEGCVATYSLKNQEKHDSMCSFKVIDCSLGCGARVMRQDMEAHTTGPCEMRPVSCPYALIGCDGPVPQRTMPNHLVENADNHLRMLYEASAKMSIRVEELETWANDLVANDNTRREGIRAIDTALLALETKHLELDTNTTKHTAKLEARVRELESTVKKQAVELVSVRKQLADIVKTVSQLSKH